MSQAIGLRRVCIDDLDHLRKHYEDTLEVVVVESGYRVVQVIDRSREGKDASVGNADTL